VIEVRSFLCLDQLLENADILGYLDSEGFCWIITEKQAIECECRHWSWKVGHRTVDTQKTLLRDHLLRYSLTIPAAASLPAVCEGCRSILTFTHAVHKRKASIITTHYNLTTTTRNPSLEVPFSRGSRETFFWVAKIRRAQGRWRLPRGNLYLQPDGALSFILDLGNAPKSLIFDFF